MAKLLFQTFPKGDGENIKNFLDTHLINTQLVFDKRSSLSFLRYEAPQIFMLETAVIDRNIVTFVQEIRKAQFNHPIIILGENIQGESKKFIGSKSDGILHLINVPFTESELLSLCKKLLINPSLGAQKFTRYKTDFLLDVEGLHTGELQTSRMINLSKGGAYCEFETAPKFDIGEFLKLTIPADGEFLERTMNGKIVWIKKKSLSNPKPGLGVRFVGMTEFYQSLLG